ncbi:MAG TPA: helix-turn-helix domain-containing protein, partial [Acidimicrobiales bacterium]|nr:helix-turn-helix domain-containing protein [Acidimicrobiales bacterium]
DTQARLLAAAADLFASHGVDAVSVDAVAEAAGRTSGAVYAHFGSKQGLLLALLESLKDSALALLLAEVAVSNSPEEQLRSVWQHASGAAGGGWDLLQQELWLRAARDPDVAAVLAVRSAQAREYSARQLAAWTRRVGAYPVAEPAELAVLVRALVAGLAMQRRLEPGSVSDDLAVRGLAALVGLPRASGRSGDGQSRRTRPEPGSRRPAETTHHE